MYQLQSNDFPGVIRIADGATIPPDPDNRDWAEYQKWLAAGNTPDPAPLPSPAELAAAAYAGKIAAGITIASTIWPGIAGTYAIDEAASVAVAGIYAGIKGGDGMPGGGAAFFYPDAAGGMHQFDPASFVAFAKALRDYRYALAQALAASPLRWPAQPVTLG